MADVSPRIAAAVVLVALAACRSDPSPPAATGTTTSSSRPTVSATAATPAEAAAALPPPALSAMTKLALRQGQGGPAMMRCNGVVSLVELDLVKNDWSYGTCDAKGGDVGSALLSFRRGHLTAADRTAIDDAFGRATLVEARCASDAGVRVVELTGGDGGVTRYSCKEPHDLRLADFERVVYAIVARP